MNPAEELGEKVEIIVGCDKFNISTTTYKFQTTKLALEIYTPVDSFQLFDQCNSTNIDPDMTILVQTNISFKLL
jgi:thymidylate kinase